MATPGNNSYVFQGGPLLGWAWDWDAHKLYDTAGTVVNQGGALPSGVINTLRQDPASAGFFDQYYSRYGIIPYQGYQVRGQGAWEGEQAPADGGQPQPPAQPPPAQGRPQGWNGDPYFLQWENNGRPLLTYVDNAGNVVRGYPKEDLFSSGGYNAGWSWVGDHIEGPGGMKVYSDPAKVWQDWEQRTGQTRPQNWQRISDVPQEYTGSYNSWQGGGQQQPPPQQQQPSQPSGPQPIGGLQNFTVKQKEFLQAHPEWYQQGVVRVDAKQGPYQQWLYNPTTGEYLTASRGAKKLDELSSGTREYFQTLPSVSRYIPAPTASSGQQPTQQQDGNMATTTNAGGTPTSNPGSSQAPSGASDWTAVMQAILNSFGFPGGQLPDAGTGPVQFPPSSSFPPPWNYGGGGWPSGYSPGQTVGGDNGAYRVPFPGGPIGGEGFVWPWQEGGAFGPGDQGHVENAQNWLAVMLPWLEMQRQGTQFNQEFNEAQRRWNNEFSFGLANTIWGQMAQQAQFDEDVRRFGLNYALQQAEQSGYQMGPDGQLRPTMDMMNLLNQQWAARGQMPVMDANGQPVLDAQGNPVFANTLQQNQFIADAFGFRINPNTGERELTLPAQQQLQNLWQQRGFVPVMNPDGSYVLDENGNPLLAPSEEHSSRIAEQFGYRINPTTGQLENTIERDWYDLQSALARAQQTGMFEGGQTTAEQQRQFENALAAAGLTGQYGEAQTVQEQQRQYENFLRTQAQQSDIASQTGFVYDPFTSERVQTLAGQQQGWMQDFQNRQQQQDYSAVRAGLTGQFEGQDTVANQQRQWENWWAQQQQQQAQQNLGGFYTDAQGNQQQTLAGQQAQRDWAAQQANLTGWLNWPGEAGGGTNPQTGEPWPTQGTQTLAGQQQQWQQGFSQSEANRAYELAQKQQDLEREANAWGAFRRSMNPNARWL